MASLHLQDPVTDIPLVGPEYAQKLHKLGIELIEDLLHHYPHRYIDRSDFTPIEEVLEGEVNTIMAQVVDFKNVFTRNGKNIQQALVADETGQIQITWFNQRYLEKAIHEGQWYAFSGKPKAFRGKLSLSAPEFERRDPDQETQSLHTGRLVPVYPETAHVSSKWIRSRLMACLKQVHVDDSLPTKIIREHNLLPLSQALQQIHFPESQEELLQAKKRLAFDELFSLQLEGAYKRYRWNQKLTQPLTIASSDLADFFARLPFKLTKAQEQAIKEILSDLKRSRPMNRLLEGDVGSGKTVVAAAAILACIKAGRTALLMAPTEILAIQHYKELHRLLDGMGLTIGLQTGSKKTETADVMVGTHALLFNLQATQNVGLIVIDEQHRFGVEQRAKLENIDTDPHRLTMSATPIPRTVALTIYGDLDLSILDEMPKQRKLVKTWIVPEVKRLKGYAWIQDQMKEHQSQAFVVCPLIDQSDSEKLIGVRSAKQEYDYLKPIFKKHKLGLLHGKIKATEKEKIVQDFKKHDFDLLVTTPVIEVGIDVPNATIMIIEAAERFGLAQLHQLRGRVGRGEKQSYCLLFTSTQDKQESERLQSLTKYNSGFKLAQIDLKLRGPGEVFGMSQHGFSRLKIANLSDKQLLIQTKQAAESLIGEDPTLAAYPLLARKIEFEENRQIASN